MGAEFTPVFLLLLAAIAIGGGMMIASAVLGSLQRDKSQADAL